VQHCAVITGRFGVLFLSCVCVGGVVLCRCVCVCVCVCDLLIFFTGRGVPQ